MVSHFLFSFAIMIITATVMTYIFNRLKQPSILAFIITGVLIGPLGFGWVRNTQEIISLSQIGIAFLLFSVGVSTELSKFRKLRISIVLVPIVNIILTFVSLMVLKNVLTIDIVQALYLSLIISFSSTMLVAKALLDNYEISSLYGKISIGILLFEDLIAVLAIPILADVANFSFSLIISVFIKAIILILLAFILNKFIYPTIIKHTFKSSDGFFLLTVGSCFLFILFSINLEFPIAIGAFIGGLAISIFPYNLEISSKISSIRDLLVMVFFVSLGMQLSFNFSNDYYLLIFLFLLLFVLKPLVHFLVLLFSGYGKRISSQVTLNLTQISEFSLILAMQALSLNQITKMQYSAVIILASFSMILTPYLSRLDNKIYKVLKPLFKARHFSKRINFLNNLPKKLEDHMIIVGSDVVGEGIINVLCRDKEIPIVIVDLDPEKILSLINKGIHCVCGNINNEEIINSTNVSKARLAVLTLPSFNSSVRFLKTAKSLNPNLKVYTRAKTKKQALKLYELGADLVILPEVLESNFLLDRINSFIEGEDNISSYKSVYISYLKKELEPNDVT